MAIFKPITIAAFVGDEHTNSTVGLSTIEMATDDGGTYRASNAQLWILAQFNDYCQKLEKCIKNGIRRNRFVWINNGEVVEGIHHNTTQICTSNLARQVENAVKALQPILKLKPDSSYILSGTEAHSGPAGMWDELFARDIGAVPVYENKQPEDNEYAWRFLLLDIGGFLFDIAHTGKFGSLTWTGLNSLNQISMDAYIYYTSRSERVPDYIIRSHTHHWGESGVSKNIKIKTISIPSWQLGTAYAAQRKPGRVLDIGGYIFEIGGGRCNYEPVIYQPPGNRICKEA